MAQVEMRDVLSQDNIEYVTVATADELYAELKTRPHVDGEVWERPQNPYDASLGHVVTISLQSGYWLRFVAPGNDELSPEEMADAICEEIF